MIITIETLEKERKKYRDQYKGIIDSHIELWLRYKQLLAELRHAIKKADPEGPACP